MKYYKIPKLPTGWFVSEMSFSLCDDFSVKEACETGDDKCIREIKVKLEDNGIGHFLVMTVEDGDHNALTTLEIDAESLTDIGKFCNAVVCMVDTSNKEAYDATHM